tara:strand:+ start:366 stop:596 length:231 start_codon:yes stop_codon:yes gene_type:complete
MMALTRRVPATHSPSTCKLLKGQLPKISAMTSAMLMLCVGERRRGKTHSSKRFSKPNEEIAGEATEEVTQAKGLAP